MGFGYKFPKIYSARETVKTEVIAMSSSNDSGIGNGAGSNPQTDFMEYEYEQMEEDIFAGLGDF